MRRIFEILKDNPLFHAIAFSDFERMLGCLSVRTVNYQRDGIILLAGDSVDFVGFVLEGSVRIIQEDYQGNPTLLAEVGRAESFGEVYACAGISHSPVTVQAAEQSEVLLIDFGRLLTSCSNACPYHTKLIGNMVRLIAESTLVLSRKVEVLSKRTTREKLRCFLTNASGNARRFTIPFNREELARYLCVDRSAMSKELCRMRDEGLIRFDRATFELLGDWAEG